MSYWETSSPFVAAIIICCLAYAISIPVYRLHYSPLARFPGPRLAALTSWYEFYYDCLRRGRFTWAVDAIHNQYGPIVRITPHELHINDPSFSDHLYSFRGKLDRYEGVTKQFGMDDATVFTVSHDLHRLRRAALAPYFSRNLILSTEKENVVGGKLAILTDRLQQVKDAQRPVDLNLAFKSLVTDVVTEYALGKSYNLLQTPDFNAAWFRAQRDTGQFVLFAKHFPWLIPLLRRLPLRLISLLSHEMGQALKKSKDIQAQVRLVIRDRKNKTPLSKRQSNLFDHLLHSSLPLEEKNVGHLTSEGVAVIGAGSDTTGIALTVATFHILNSPSIHMRLKKELEESLPDPSKIPSWPEVENLPYLSAIIKEGLRLAHGTSNRLPRVSKTSMSYRDWIIPPNTPISMSPMLIHQNEHLFPNHRTFDPQRWLQPQSKDLEKHLLMFGKGPRGCLGRDLAYAELYVTLATIFRRFDLKLFETSREDVDAKHDFMVPCPKLDSKGMRVLVTGSRVGE